MSRKKGDVAEEKATKYLLDNDFTILDRNFYSKFGEIDIVALKDDILHFVEVKSGEDYEKAIQNITSKKLSKLIKTGDIYMKKSNFDVDFEYDAIIVSHNDIWYVENITI